MGSWADTHGLQRFWGRQWLGFRARPMMLGALMQIKYSQDHQYVIVEDGVGTVGITNYAQEKLNEVTTVELPHVGAQVQKGGAVCVVESVKAASDIYSPVSGEILNVNAALADKPELVNEDAEGAGWIYKIKLAEPSELDTLLDQDTYLAYARERG
jgi:glycine cleavage system H protein